MANRRQKKKKSAAAAKQAATQYKGKNAPIKAAPAKKPVDKPVSQPEKPVAKPAAEPKKPEPKKEDKKITQPKKAETQKVEPKKAKLQQPKSSKNKSEKAKPKKKNVHKKTQPVSKLIKSKIEKIGIRKFSLIVLCVCLAVAVVCVLFWVTSSRFGIPDSAIVDYAGRNYSSDITLNVNEDIETQHEFADKMKRKGDKKAFRYYAAEEIVFVEKNSRGALNLVNVYDNDCVIIASIVDESGNVCFTSLGIPAGQCLSDIGINERPYGTYDMKLVVAGYDPETYKLIGVQSSDLTVQVGIEEETSDVKESHAQ